MSHKTLKRIALFFLLACLAGLFFHSVKLPRDTVVSPKIPPLTFAGGSGDTPATAVIIQGAPDYMWRCGRRISISGEEIRQTEPGLASGVKKKSMRTAPSFMISSASNFPTAPNNRYISISPRILKSPKLWTKSSLKAECPFPGEVAISGAKNAALPIIAATLLAPGVHKLYNVPPLADIRTTKRLLGLMGVQFEDGEPLVVDSTNLTGWMAPYETVKTMRAAVLVLGPLVARARQASVSLPGGCAIGARPIDQHLKGLEAMGAKITLNQGYVEAGQTAARRRHHLRPAHGHRHGKPDDGRQPG